MSWKISALFAYSRRWTTVETFIWKCDCSVVGLESFSNQHIDKYATIITKRIHFHYDILCLNYFSANLRSRFFGAGCAWKSVTRCNRQTNLEFRSFDSSDLIIKKNCSKFHRLSSSFCVRSSLLQMTIQSVTKCCKISTAFIKHKTWTAMFRFTLSLSHIVHCNRYWLTRSSSPTLGFFFEARMAFFILVGLFYFIVRWT